MNMFATAADAALQRSFYYASKAPVASVRLDCCTTPRTAWYYVRIWDTERDEFADVDYPAHELEHGVVSGERFVTPLFDPKIDPLSAELVKMRA
jgi:hypothetical protein